MIDRSLLNLLPPPRRARGDRLYGADGRHWVDLWKQDGAWLLGHRPEGAAKEWKIQLDKGLAAWAPSLWPRRLEALASRLVPGTVRVFRNADRSPAFPLWRPWSGEPAAGSVRLVLPTGPAQAVAVVFGEGWKDDIPDHDVVSPAEAASLVRACAEVLRHTADARSAAARGAVQESFDRWIGPSGAFRRTGHWIWCAQDHAALFRSHLDAGYLLNPDPESPSLLPSVLSDGEWKAWRAVVE